MIWILFKKNDAGGFVKTGLKGEPKILSKQREEWRYFPPRREHMRERQSQGETFVERWTRRELRRTSDTWLHTFHRRAHILSFIISLQ
jgi:hypothetical protein